MFGKRTEVPVFANVQKLRALLDMGSAVTLIRTEFVAPSHVDYGK